MDYIITTLPVRRLSFFISPLSLSLSLSLCIYIERETACVRESIDAGAMCCHLSPTWVGVLPVTLDRATTPKPSADRAFPGHAAHPERRRRACVRTYVRGARRIGGAVDGGGVGGCPSLVSCLPAAARLVGGIVCCCFRRSCFLARIDFATGVIRCGQPGTSWKCAIIN
jgi:hypothetical protein